MSNRSNQVLIAALGLVGVLATGVFSNWDKLFAKNPTVQAAYTGYKPTGDFETELRYFLDVSGSRATMDAFQKSLIENQKQQLLIAYPNDAATITKIFDIASQEMIKFDDIIAELLPVYQKYYTVDELQQLNKFYSTDAMRQMVKQGPLIVNDTIPITNKLVAELQGRIQRRIKEAQH